MDPRRDERETPMSGQLRVSAIPARRVLDDGASNRVVDLPGRHPVGDVPSRRMPHTRYGSPSGGSTVRSQDVVKPARS